MRTRLTALVLVAGLAMTGVADAATKHKQKPKPPPPVCHLITDPSGDSGPADNAGGSSLNDPSLDITSADVATNATMITAVIRVKQLAQSDTDWPLGREWQLHLATSTGHNYGFTAVDGPARPASPSAGHLTMDYAHGEIRISQTLSSLPFALPKGTKLDVLTASADAAVQLPDSGPAGLGQAFLMPGWSEEDTAAAPPSKSYTVGAPSCVKVGS